MSSDSFDSRQAHWLTGWVGIVELLEWATIGKHLDNFSLGEVPSSVVKYFICLEYDKFLYRRISWLPLL